MAIDVHSGLPSASDPRPRALRNRRLPHAYPIRRRESRGRRSAPRRPAFAAKVGSARTFSDYCRSDGRFTLDSSRQGFPAANSFTKNILQISMPRSRARNSEAVILDSSHSQIVLTLQPNRRSLRSFSMSRALLPSSFGSQKPLLVCGTPLLGQRCRCQKHPLTCKAMEYFGSTMSGHPGRLLTCSRNRKPIAWSAWRTMISGRVSFERMLAMIADRCSGVILSAIGIIAFLPTRPVGTGTTGTIATVLGREAILRNHASLASGLMPHSRIS